LTFAPDSPESPALKVQRRSLVKRLIGVKRGTAAFIFAAVTLLWGAFPTAAADIRPGWGSWWLPPVRSTHGDQIDTLFVWTFWITMVVFIAVEVVLVYFMIRYRSRPDVKKAYFTHGHTRLEMAWTIAPAIIFIALAAANKGVWERLRFSPDADRADVARILVIGQQFKWNVVYPGPDGKLGKYLLFPKPTDTRWPGGITYAGVKGPAFLPNDRAVRAINNYVDQVNPLGKDFDDPAGKDDDWSKTAGRPIYIPVNRPIEVQLGSKDVIHDFFLPNYRVKLDAVPGLRGKIMFTAVMTSREREQASARKYKLDELAEALGRITTKDLELRIDETTKHPAAEKDKTGWRFIDPKDPKKNTIIRADSTFPGDAEARAAIIQKLRDAGVTEVTAFQPGAWELVCEELCGQGHTTMRGEMIVLDDPIYQEKFEKKKTAAGPTSAPARLARALP
jgi:heme/copper-type cytochrome/quinol oxidase subunit 2